MKFYKLCIYNDNMQICSMLGGGIRSFNCMQRYNQNSSLNAHFVYNKRSVRL